LLARTRHHTTVLPLHGEPARRITSNSTQSTEATLVSQCQDIFPPPPLPAIEAPRAQKSSPEPTSARLYKGLHGSPCHPAPPRPIPPPSRALHRHHQRRPCRLGCRPPAAVDLPPQSVPDQGEERNELPSSSSSFCPTSRPSPWPGSPAPLPLPPVGLPVSSVQYGEGREEEDGCFSHTPCPFSTFPNRTSPLFPSLPSLKIRPYTLNYTTKTTMSFTIIPLGYLVKPPLG
jgi:hypothetical protein